MPKRKLKHVGLTKGQYIALVKLIQMESLSDEEELLIKSARWKFQAALQEIEKEEG